MTSYKAQSDTLCRGSSSYEPMYLASRQSVNFPYARGVSQVAHFPWQGFPFLYVSQCTLLFVRICIRITSASNHLCIISTSVSASASTSVSPSASASISASASAYRITSASNHLLIAPASVSAFASTSVSASASHPHLIIFALHLHLYLHPRPHQQLYPHPHLQPQQLYPYLHPHHISI